MVRTDKKPMSPLPTDRIICSFCKCSLEYHEENCCPTYWRDLKYAN